MNSYNKRVLHLFLRVLLAQYKNRIGHAIVPVMAKLHCWTRIRIPTQTRIPNRMAALSYAEDVHIAQTRTRIPTPFFCIGQESESVPVSVTEYGSVIM